MSELLIFGAIHVGTGVIAYYILEFIDYIDSRSSRDNWGSLSCLFCPVLLAARDLPWYSDATAKRSNRDNIMEIKAQQFVTSTGRQVLTDNGQQGMGGVAGIGSTTEKHQGRVAEAIFANCAELDNGQLNEIIEWVRLYQRWMPPSGRASGIFYAPCLIPRVTWTFR